MLVVHNTCKYKATNKTLRLNLATKEDKYRNGKNLTNKQQHRLITCQNMTEKDLTIIVTVCELFLNE
jgi:hypothetical protein